MLTEEQLGGLPLATPAVVVDAGVLEDNLQSMATTAAAAGRRLRPHAKTHKCREIARRQIELGAVGLTVATLAEAEVFAEADVGDLFVAYPVWVPRHDDLRLRRLAGQARLSVGADSVAGIRRLAAGLGSERSGVGIMVEVDCGLRRTGVRPEEAAELAREVLDAGMLLDGVFTYPGHSYAPGAVASAAVQEAEALRLAREVLSSSGIECAVCSGGSTPTARLSALGAPECPGELRPGVYAFNDAQQLELGTCRAGEVALGVLTTVVSSHADDRVVVDAGSKVLGADRPAWMPGHGCLAHVHGARVEWLWEHHAIVVWPSEA